MMWEHVNQPATRHGSTFPTGTHRGLAMTLAPPSFPDHLSVVLQPVFALRLHSELTIACHLTSDLRCSIEDPLCDCF